MASSLPEEIQDLPPSAELVYRVLDDVDEAAVTDLYAELCCARSTIGESLHRLEEVGVVTSRPDPSQLGQRLWQTENWD